MSLLALLLLAAQTTAAAPPSAPPKVDCTDADHRAFDFWVGYWDVYAGTTKVAHSRIEKIVGCAISETFDQDVGPGGKPVDYHGRSISSYVPADKGWRQFYTDNGGAAAMLTGGITGGAMVLLSRNGPVTNRMTVKPNPDGSVTQRGEFSTDEGKTWKPGYEFTYRKHAAT
ncbi:MAG: hypothetical protein E7773_08840 [Sphingomonas sp.]|uniref:hypothetical protein n=1 Tax=Sphingomonas sp. TaxID=28214 RepID=UPI00120ACB80|nr:hypothetical protein [Sphingomonas sp.]THD36036.1 MAG: hypothetical protein E7773_08840 [Sphingomonas sp.]